MALSEALEEQGCLQLECCCPEPSGLQQLQRWDITCMSGDPASSCPISVEQCLAPAHLSLCPDCPSSTLHLQMVALVWTMITAVFYLIFNLYPYLAEVGFSRGSCTLLSDRWTFPVLDARLHAGGASFQTSLNACGANWRGLHARQYRQ